MSATVARTSRWWTDARPVRHVVRVTHALLFLAAATAPSGVCDACHTHALLGGPAVCCGADSALHGDRGEAAAANAVAATHCCPSVADAGDGAPYTSAGCRCQLAPRDLDDQGVVPPAVAHDTAAGGPAWPIVAGVPETAVAVLAAADRAVRDPGRPARVLFGVWRN